MLEGFAPRGATIELFLAEQEEDNKFGGIYFGEGARHILSLTEGGTGSNATSPYSPGTNVDRYADLDATTGSYSNSAGVETGAPKFRYRIPLSAIPTVVPFVKLTATSIATASTVAAIGGVQGNTSEFSANVVVIQEELCTDGIDNDLDGLTDCDDPDCGRPIVDAGPDQTVCPAAIVTLTGSATGGNAPYTYSWSDGLGNTASVTLTAAATKTYTLTVTDANGCVGNGTVQVTISDVVNPVFGPYVNTVSVECNATGSVAGPTATDDCGAATVTSADAVGAATCVGSYQIIRTYTATDGSGNTATTTQVIDVQDTQPPTFTLLFDDVVADCGDAVAKPAVTSADDCDPSPVIAYAETLCDDDVNAAYYYDGGQILHVARLGAFPSLTYLSTVQPIGLSALCSYDVSKEQRWSVSNPNAFDVAITYGDGIVDSLGHYLVPANADLRFFTQPIVGNLEVTWQNESALPQTLNAAPSNVNCSLPAPEVCGCTITRTWTSTDDCGNATTTRQLVHYIDQSQPVLGNLPPATLTVSCDNIPAPAGVTVSDACSPGTPVNLVEATTAGTCANAYTITRTWTAVDACGNAVGFVQTITVTDTVAPVMASVPAAITIECGTAEPTALPTATDVCDAAPVVTVASTTTAGACAGRVHRDPGLHGDRRVRKYIDREPGRHDRGHDCTSHGGCPCGRHDRVRGG